MTGLLNILFAASTLFLGPSGCASSPTGESGPAFDQHLLSSSGNGSIHAMTADLHGDGDPDILSGAFYSGTITWHVNQGGSFSSQRVATGFQGVRNVCAEDLDGDGDLDVLACAFQIGAVSWWENTGGTAWTTHTLTDSLPGANRVCAGDLDADGDLDIVAGSWNHAGTGTDRIIWYENEGSGGFTDHPISESRDRVSGLATADLDGDGDLDIISADFGTSRIIWLENTGDGFIPTIVASGFMGCHWIWPHDIDGDSDVDLAGAAMQSNTVAWFENDGSGIFLRHIVDDSVLFAGCVHVADMDGDGMIDLLASSGGSGALYWWKEGPGGWQRHTITESLDQPLSVWADDLDGDGDTDVVGTDFDTRILAWWEHR